MPSSPTLQTPVALTIAGSDNSAGAGIQADMKTMTAHGVYGLTAVTCVVAEAPGQVSSIHPIPPAVVAEQVRLCFAHFPVAAAKTGMLFSTEIIDAVCEVLEERAAAGARTPLVVDPVMVSTSGSRLLKAEAVERYRTRLFPLADLLTPNLDEAAALLERTIEGLEGLRAAAGELHEGFGRAVLLKGGHLRTNPAIDIFVDADGKRHELFGEYFAGVSTHGTGCTYAAAIASHLAHGRSLLEAVQQARKYMVSAVGKYFEWKAEAGTTHALRHM